MQLTVFNGVPLSINKKEIVCFEDALELLLDDLDIQSYESVEIHKNEITVLFLAKDHQIYGSSNIREYGYFFNIKDKVLSNGADDIDDVTDDIDWDKISMFYHKYANIQDRFIDAIMDGDLSEIKKLHAQYPDVATLNINDSFYFSYFISFKNINFLNWLKEVDPNLEFNITSKKTINPLITAIQRDFEEGALWLLDNFINLKVYEEANPLYIIKQVIEYKMDNLYTRIISNQEFLNIILELNALEYLPETAKDIFIF